MSRNLILFDVDGTIAESGQIIDKTIKTLIKQISKNFDIGIVGGGTKEKILFQLEDLYFNHYFFECGCVYHVNNSLNKEEINLNEKYTKNIREHILYPKINILVKQALLFLSNVDYTISGNFIDLRNGMIYISLIGMSATIDERSYFVNLNKNSNYRKKLLDILINKAIELGINNNVTICEGGTVGLAIYPVENDKEQVIKHLSDYNEIYYLGDKYDENGNDFKIINNKKIIGCPVDNIEMTKNVLTKLIDINN
jgi:HAD superfamily hydrolase (TIGR01484 family)